MGRFWGEIRTEDLWALQKGPARLRELMGRGGGFERQKSGDRFRVIFCWEDGTRGTGVTKAGGLSLGGGGKRNISGTFLPNHQDR